MKNGAITAAPRATANGGTKVNMAPNATPTSKAMLMNHNERGRSSTGSRRTGADAATRPGRSRTRASRNNAITEVAPAARNTGS